ncbi:MAG TPA: thiamine pyrophosphate-dependent enzyme [Opitutaceae bacterium]
MAKVDSSLDAALQRRLLTLILESRHGDLREENLNRQGKGHFHVSAEGHEAMAAIGLLLETDDYACPYYRDRAFVLGRGVSTRQLALDYFAKRDATSHGRQMPSHYCYRELNIWSVPTPTASQLLPACGMAWGMQLDGKKNVVVTSVGEASTRQGDFYEAVCFARERQLPVLFVVEDNAYGISTPTRATNPLALNVLEPEAWTVIDGWDVAQVYMTAARLLGEIRAGAGPRCLWLKLERLASHTSSDDQKIYRSPEEIAAAKERDPLRTLRGQMIEEGSLTPAAFEQLDAEVKESVRAAYVEAEQAENPLPGELEVNISAVPPELDEEIFKPGTYRIGDVINKTLRAGLDSDPRRVIFGEDVEDPKGGVFRLTRELSTDFPGQVFNSPLAESTILGVACGLASYGRRPVFELQFIDFIYPGWNQLVTNLATLRWRTFGKWTCPAVIYAPYGAYLPGGSLWHSQANEAALAHYPGLSVVIPSSPEDAAGLLWTALHAEDPVIFLIPKHMLWAEREVKKPLVSVPLGHASRLVPGSDVTLVAWGNTVEKAQEALAVLGGTASVELIDLRSIVPWDREMIEESVRRTGRLVIVQEDTENCSVGQMIISHLTGRADVWSRFIAPPVLVSKGNVMIGYNPIYEYAALPSVQRIVDAVRRVMQYHHARGETEHPAVPTQLPAPSPSAAAAASRAPRPENAAAEPPPAAAEVAIKLPIMGEGIRTARVVALLKQPGDAVSRDEALCEIETEKAVYPIESSFAGTFKAWKVKVDDVVAVGQEIAVLTSDTGSAGVPPSQRVATGGAGGAPASEPLRAGGPLSPDIADGRAPASDILPALSPAITKRVAAVVPANMQLDVRWTALRSARDAAKQAGHSFSPSLLLAWCVTRAMTGHAAFRRVVTKDGAIQQLDNFDLGIAVALEGDRLATAVVHRAPSLEFSAFASAYQDAIAATRSGKLEDVNAPLNLTSLGAFGIELAMPIVVPPAMGTLFVGTAHEKMINDGGSVYPVEVISLSLTFDHRVINGAGAAAFLHSVKTQVEGFALPA